MTNREMLIRSLESMAEGGEDVFDDGYASAESNVAYWVACPYRGHEKKRFPFDGLKYPWSTLDVCGPCKEAWLNEEASE